MSQRSGKRRRGAASVVLALSLSLLLSGCADPRAWVVCGLGLCQDVLDERAPAGPTGLSARAFSRKVTLNWADNTEPDLVEYRVYRATTQGGPYAQVGSSLFSEDSDEAVANDTTYHYVVRAVDRAGNVGRPSNEASATPSAAAGGGGATRAFLAAWGSHGGGNGQFDFPRGIATDRAGNVYVSDAEHRIQKFRADGTFLTSWGRRGSGNGDFDFPSGIATDSVGNVYVVDTGNDRVQKFRSDGTFMLSWGSSGSGNGRFGRPIGIAADSGGNVYVADTDNNRIQKFTSAGDFVTAWESFGKQPERFLSPAGVAADSAGNVYVADRLHNRIRKFTGSGGFLGSWGGGGIGNGHLESPAGVAALGTRSVFVADTGHNRVQEFTTEGAFVTKWGSLGTGQGQFDSPGAVATDCRGNIYVVDRDNHRVQKFGNPAADPPPCVATPRPPFAAALRLRSPGPPTLVLRSGPRRLELTFATSATRAGALTEAGGKLTEKGARARGTFKASGGSRALPLTRFSGGVWRSLFDVVVDPRAGKGTATGFTLVTFRDRRAGQLCLGFEITYAVAGNAARLGGSFSARGGTRGAARVVARGSYKQVLKRGGRVSPLGTGSARLGEPRGLPRQCRRLKAAFGPG